MPSPTKFWLWFGGIWVGVGAPFLFIGLLVGARAIQTDRRFPAEAHTAQGLVLTKSLDKDNGSWVAYRFSTSEGRTVKGNARVTTEVWDRLAERGPIEVSYLPDLPEASRIPGQLFTEEVALPAIFTALGGILTALGSFVLIRWRGRRGRALKGPSGAGRSQAS